MKIAVIHKNLAIGGGELLLTLLAKESIKHGYKFDIILFEKNVEYPIYDLKIKFLSPFRSINHFFRIALFPYFFIALLLSVRRYEAILTFERYQAYINTILAWILSKTSIIYVQNPLMASFNDIYKNNFVKKIHILFHSLVFRRSKVIITVSHGIKNELIEMFKVDNNKIFVIEPWVDMKMISLLLKEKLSIEEKTMFKNKKILITVGRLNRQKNFKKLIMIFSLVSKHIQNAILLIIGEGEERPNILKAIATYNLKDKVILLGSQDNPFKYMRYSSVFVLPSQFEGYPHVILEAIVCRLPVVVADSPFGIREIVAPELKNTPIKIEYEGKYGTLVANNKDTVKNTANILINILKNDDKKIYFDKKITNLNNYFKKKWLKLLKNI